MHEIEHMTMYLKICAAIVLMQISISIAFAVDDKKNSATGGPSAGDARRAGGLRAGFNEILPRPYSRHAARAVVPARTSQTTQEGVP